MDGEQCAICSKQATPKTIYCELHGANINRWKKRSPSDVLRRRDQLRTQTAYTGVVVDIKGEEIRKLKAYTK
jgi:hypothetical protein